MSQAERQIAEKVRMVAACEGSFGVLSTGEKIAVALVLDRYDLVQECWGTMLEAVHRLGAGANRARESTPGRQTIAAL